MSKLNRVLSQSLAQLKGCKTPLYKRIYYRVCEGVDSMKDFLLYYEIRQFFRNLPRALKNAWRWREYDYCYTIEELADNLERIGKAMRIGHHTNSEQSYRKAVRAAWQLRKAYNYSCVEDTSYKAWNAANPISFEEIQYGEDKGSYKVMTRHSRKGKDYSDKMWKVIHRRTEAIEKAKKKEAWEYIHKHIESFWE